jgi:hypothetical protein
MLLIEPSRSLGASIVAVSTKIKTYLLNTIFALVSIPNYWIYLDSIDFMKYY